MMAVWTNEGTNLTLTLYIAEKKQQSVYHAALLLDLMAYSV